MPSALLSSHVFVNCPFDAGYQPIFNAIVFAIHELGFIARCALEDDDAGEVRLSKIERIVESCQFGIHDLSAVALDTNTGLPRFNMPLELGVFLGCRRFGGDIQRTKVCLILDRERYRYRAFISDISGQDIHAHGGDPEQAIREVRNWLAVGSKGKAMPGGGEVVNRYRRFADDLPGLCAGAKLDPAELTFNDLCNTIDTWLEASR